LSTASDRGAALFAIVLTGGSRRRRRVVVVVAHPGEAPYDELRRAARSNSEAVIQSTSIPAARKI
jgi:hypothetical protein